MVGSGSGKRRNQPQESRHEHASFLAAAVERPSTYRINLSEKAFHGTVIPGQTFSSETNYTFLRG
jgi:hypothetical protein